MTQLYRFKINGIEVTPLYDDKLEIIKEQEEGQMFFRKKLSGKIIILNLDFDWLDSQSFETEFVLSIEYYLNNTWADYYSGSFTKIDCLWDYDNKKVEITTSPIDEYTKILGLQDKEIDLISLMPAVQPVYIKKRPLIQVYVPGSTIIANFLAGTYWEQQCEEITNTADLVNIYKFSQMGAFNEFEARIQTGSTQNLDVEGYYAGRKTTTGTYNATRGGSENWKFEVTVNPAGPYYHCTLRSLTDNVIYFDSTTTHTLNPLTTWALLSGVNGRTGAVRVKLAREILFYGRMMLNVSTFLGYATFNIPANDICDNNLNYRKLYPYSENLCTVNPYDSATPTEYGLNDNERYFMEPYYPGARFYPIARNSWGNSSYWFMFSAINSIYDTNGSEEVLIKDAYWIHEVLSKLLSSNNLGLTFNNTLDYSELLYQYNYASLNGENLNLIFVPKSNILSSSYDQPAKKAPITLKDIFDMLKICFKAYWFIDGTKIRIEHKRWFDNGSSSTSETVQLDLTNYIDPRTLKPWSFGTNKISYDSSNGSKSIQFQWMDDSTKVFNGYSIEMLNKTTNNSTESLVVNKFSTDIDYMLLNPSAISKDGFALLNVVEEETNKWIVPIISLFVNNYSYEAQNGRLSFAYLHDSYYFYDMPTWNININKLNEVAISVIKSKLQEVEIPNLTDLDVFKLIKTGIGNGQIKSIVTNLSSRLHKVVLAFQYCSINDTTTTTTSSTTTTTSSTTTTTSSTTTTTSSTTTQSQKTITFESYEESKGTVNFNNIPVSPAGASFTVPFGEPIYITVDNNIGFEASLYLGPILLPLPYEDIATSNMTLSVIFGTTTATTTTSSTTTTTSSTTTTTTVEPESISLFFLPYDNTNGSFYLGSDPIGPGGDELSILTGQLIEITGNINFGYKGVAYRNDELVAFPYIKVADSNDNEAVFELTIAIS